MELSTGSPVSSVNSPSSSNKSDLGYESEHSTCSSILMGLLTNPASEKYKSRSRFLAQNCALKRTRQDSLSSTSSAGDDSCYKNLTFTTPPKKRYTCPAKFLSPQKKEQAAPTSPPPASSPSTETKQLKTRYILQWEGSVPKLGPEKYDPQCTPTSPHLSSKANRPSSFAFQTPLTPVRRSNVSRAIANSSKKLSQAGMAGNECPCTELTKLVKEILEKLTHSKKMQEKENKQNHQMSRKTLPVSPLGALSSPAIDKNLLLKVIANCGALTKRMADLNEKTNVSTIN
ncbi:hypothetical protein Ciccas_010990 [Cichlidogyrus casuarinus]|uniref:Uncharacterized protein n=1 Tax=Cichlidogyrus casuarinus TaxID=1844966 RepID=A0ABD2PU75_9PLAT